MTMPIQFDTAQYIKRLVDAGISHAHAEALADGLQFALSQPVATDADLVIARAELQAMFTRHEAEMKEWAQAQFVRYEAEMKRWMMAQLKPIYASLGLLVIMQVITMTKLFL